MNIHAIASRRAPRAALAALPLLLCLALPAHALQEGQAATKPIGPEAVAPLAGRLGEAERQELAAKAQVTRYYGAQAQTALCPDAALAARIAGPQQALKPSLGIETLIVYPLPAAVAKRADRDLALYNLMHRFHRMEGIEYWSASRKTMRVFFLSSNLVKSPTDRAKLPDPAYAAPEASHSLFLEQEDSSFGKNLYDLEVDSLGPTVLLHMVNREQIWYGIAPVLAPRALSLYLSVQASPDGKYLYFYGNASINAAKAFGLEEKAKISYTNRIVALFSWYARELEAAQ